MRPGLVLRVIAALLVLALAAVVPLIGFAVLSPFSGVPVPAACDGGTAGPSQRRVDVPGHGPGIVIAADDRTTIAVVPAPDGRTAGGSVHLIAAGHDVFSLPVASRAVAGGLYGGRAYVFDDKIGYILGALTGLPVHPVLTVDNYRGLYMADGAEHVQTSLEIAILGGGSSLVVDGLPFGAIVDGCLLASAVGG